MAELSKLRSAPDLVHGKVEQEDMPERRSSRRIGMIKRGQVASGEALLRCVVLDVSATGARVHLTAAVEVPEVVILRLPDGSKRRARRSWRRDAEIGFEFLEDVEPNAEPPPRSE
jgi:hypothetical protein